MALFRLLTLLFGVVNVSHGTSTTWEIAPSRPTTPGAAPNCNKWYTGKKGDSCWSIHVAFGISLDDFYLWNPAVSAGCLSNFWIDTSYCVGVGPMVTTTTSTTPTRTEPPELMTSRSLHTGPVLTTGLSTATKDFSYTFVNPITSWNVTKSSSETARPPTKTQSGQPKNCNRWHLVKAGDDCDNIYTRYNSWMTFEEFLEWNPALKEDCRYPWIGWWVCVGVRPTSTFSISFPPATPPPMEIPFHTAPEPDFPSETASPTQPGIPTDCQAFYKAVESDTCDHILREIPLLKKEDLHKWNPVLGAECKGLIPGYCYCVAAYSPGELPMPPTVTKIPSPTGTGIVSNCVAFYKRTDGESCEEIAAMFGTFSVIEFMRWNSGLMENCIGLQDDYWYCVAIPGTPTTRTSMATSVPSVAFLHEFHDSPPSITPVPGDVLIHSRSSNRTSPGNFLTPTWYYKGL